MKEIKTSAAPASPGVISQAIEVDGLVFTSGQIHLKPDMKLVEGSTEEKTKQVMANQKAVLEAAGLSFENVVKVSVFVTDMSIYKDFNDVYVTYFDEPYPAREVVCVKELPLGASIEVSMVAKR